MIELSVTNMRMNIIFYNYLFVFMDNISCMHGNGPPTVCSIRYGAAEWLIYGIELDCGGWMPRPPCYVIYHVCSVCILVCELIRVNCRMFVLYWNNLDGYIKKNYTTRVDSDFETHTDDSWLEKGRNSWFSRSSSQLVSWSYWVVYSATRASIDLLRSD